MWLNVPTMIWEIHEIMQLEQPPRVMVGGRAVVHAITQGLHAPVVEHSDQVLAVIEQLLAGPPPDTVISADLAARVPLRAPAGPVGTEQLGTIDAAFSATTQAGAEVVRKSARHAIAMERLAHQDQLTGLPNRRAFDDRLQTIAQHGPPRGTLLMIDIDTFKAINDTHGHDAGDDALIGVGRVIVENIRTDDFAARVGGDEFVALLPAVIGAARRPSCRANQSGGREVVHQPRGDRQHRDRRGHLRRQTGPECG